MSLTSIELERVEPESWLPPWSKFEHKARYRFAATFVAGKSVIDLACGNGMGTRYFLEEKPKSLCGFDVDEAAITFCRKQFAEYETASFQKTDGTHIPVAGASADLFISLETIEHIDADAHFIKEVARTLAADGTLILSTPNRLCTNPGTHINDKPWNHFHVREYAPSELCAVLEQEFEVVGTYGQNPVPRFWKRFLERVAAGLGKRLAVRVNQFYKLRWFLFKDPAHHDVVQCTNLDDFEYIVLVCRKKRS